MILESGVEEFPKVFIAFQIRSKLTSQNKKKWGGFSFITRESSHRIPFQRYLYNVKVAIFSQLKIPNG